MPNYDYYCENCKAEFEIFHSMFADAVTECPNCLQHKLVRGIGIPRVYVKPSDSSCSLGLLAERNRDRFSEDQKTMLKKKHKTKQVWPDNYELPAGATIINKGENE